MIQITERIWIGNSKDEEEAVCEDKINAVLIVAHDMIGSWGWSDDIEYAQVGLIDGPGNPLSAYCAAILTLHMLLDRNEQVIVCCHDGSRSLAVVMMYLILKKGKTSSHPTFLNYWSSWNTTIGQVRCSCNSEQILPDIHVSHEEAFNKLPLALLEMML